jgi:potassium-transporting ATPase KdpC subunit
MRSLWIAIKLTIVLTVLTGLVYPMVVLGLGYVLFPWQAAGSLLVRNGKVMGSALIGQNFTDARYLHGRPSAAGDKGYDAANSGGSNLGPTNKALIDNAHQRLVAIIKENPGVTAAEVPVGAITASGSGLDPEISPAYAELQVPRVAKARAINPAKVREAIHRFTRRRWLGIFGEPGVNVLEVNLALDDLQASGIRRRVVRQPNRSTTRD